MIQIDIEMPKRCEVCPMYRMTCLSKIDDIYVENCLGQKVSVLLIEAKRSVEEYRKIQESERAENQRMRWCPLKEVEKEGN